jgi:hypothetical protein
MASPPVTVIRPELPASRTAGKRVVIAEDHQGTCVIVGPVYTDNGAGQLREIIEARPGWTILGTARLISKPDFLREYLADMIDD